MAGKRTPTLSWSQKDLAKAAEVAKNHGLSLNEFLSIIHHESDRTMNPAVQNSAGATGLIQFMPSTAAELLMKERRDAAMTQATTPEEQRQIGKQFPHYWQLSDQQKRQADLQAKKEMARLPVSRQLDLADRYLASRARGKKGLDAVYTAVFAGNPNVKVIEKGTQAYSNNAGLDRNRDGRLTRDEWMTHVQGREPELDAWNQTNEPAQPVFSLTQKAIQDKASGLQQSPTSAPIFSEAREASADEMFGVTPKVPVTSEQQELALIEDEDSPIFRLDAKKDGGQNGQG